ncbi:tRNA (guanine(10)-N2)-methyltransferase homolog isoform X1 [Artemia franciscana]|uniref:tRNA (guanine(10)-N2)-methyltransferase homolog isoform X1 n=2 Tax=Artemia franciscana TaxID=6661 RepID=UPI0032DA72EC
MKQYLFWLANEHVSFRLPEMMAIIQLFDIPAKFVEVPGEAPWVLLELPCESYAKRILSRTVLVRHCVEVWSKARQREELHSYMKKIPDEVLNRWRSPGVSFKIDVEPFNKNYSIKEKVGIIEEFSYLDFKGPVNLKSPDCHLYYFEYYGLNPNNIPDHPYNSFFGRLIGTGQRRLLHELSLKTRKFIGNTTMDPQLALVMANLACVSPCSLVLDPFVGTGSLLVSCAKFGAYVVGTDIDYLTIHGKSKPTRAKQIQREADERISANMSQYGMNSQLIDAFVADASRSVWRDGLRFNAIVTDPPYGIREGSSKVGSKKRYKVPAECLDKHHPSKVQYSLENVLIDLLKFAGRHLELHGRLVFWLPVYRADYSEDILPQHPCLKLIANCEQPLASHTSRRLIVMEKMAEPKDPEDEKVFVHESHSSFAKKYFQGLDSPVPTPSVKRGKRGQGLANPVENDAVVYISKALDNCNIKDDSHNQ